MPKPLAKAIHHEAPPQVDHAPSVGVVAPWRPDGVEWADSPARLLHDRLVATFAAPPRAPAPEALSPRAKLAILLGASAALWSAIGLAVAAALA